MVTDHPARRRGAPLGNRNALKHGYYSRAFLDKKDRLDLARASSFQCVDEEIALLRFKIKAVVKKDPDNFRLITEALLSLNRLLRTRGKMELNFNEALTRAYENVFRDFALPVGIDPAEFTEVRHPELQKVTPVPTEK